MDSTDTMDKGELWVHKILADRDSIKPSRAQLRVFIEYLEANPMLLYHHDKTNAAKHARRMEWYKLSKKLNAISGANKSPAAWMKFWRDKKTYLRRLEERRALAVKSGATVFPLCALDDRLLQLAKENDKFLLAKTVALPLEMAPSDPLSDEITHNNIIGHEPFIEKEEKLEEDSSPPYSPSLPTADASTAPSELSFPPETAAPHTNKNFEEIRSFERRAFRRNKTRKRSSSGFKQDQFYDMFERITALEEKRLEIDQINAQTNREAVVTAQRCAQAMEALADAIKTQGQEIADALKTNGNLIADALRAQGQIIAESISNKVL